MVRIIKKANISRTRAATTKFIGILLALLTATLFILFLGHNPIKVYISMLDGSFGSLYRFKETIINTIPLVITALGILIAFKMKFWNIGGEGQIYMGAFLSSFVALKFPEMSKPILLLLMIIAGIIGGGIWALIPAIFKAKYGTNETLFTLMMNYIAIKWITYLQFGPWKDPNALGFPKIPNFSDNATLPKLFGIHMGWLIAIILVFFTYLFMHHTKKGYEISVIGESEKTGKYAGMNVKKVIVTAMLISGGFCGLAGMIQASAVNNTLSVELSAGTGYTAIIVAWLSSLSAPLILLVSFLFAILVQGGAYIQTAFQIPQSAAQILQGMILMFVLGSEFFVNYRLVIDKKISLNNKGLEKRCE
ncbi:ABC transporter permease [Maledivibacter halophilus]|uniref:Nucleoside ABC transporter membrane protein n=1 Tax=Maledivibacter halophilus TaxID=36842 RepID=A0A1T5KHB1_9FIRM|nr:ABC transporter permease [Maledivibacter halophilus]SKC63040.1 nucleoside ABC transporter membrane protein [Maledivibacter halophilus]